MQVSIHRVYKAVGIPRSRHYYQPVNTDSAVAEAIQKHIENHPMHGFPKVFAYLRRAGHNWNHKRVHRVYKILGLSHRRKGKRRLPQRVKQPIEKPHGINQCWSIDFMHDSLLNGRKFRTFNVIDDYNRQVLTIDIAFSLTSTGIIRALEEVIEWRGKPQKLRMDNGPEFISKAFEIWCYDKQIQLVHIQPGKPMQNGLIERLNGTYRRDVLNAYLFYDLEEVRQHTDEWMEEYNERRPHEALQNLTPIEYLCLPLNKSEGEGVSETISTLSLKEI